MNRKQQEVSVLTAEATMFLESMAPVEEARGSLDFAKIETKLLEQKSNLQRGIGFSPGDGR